MDLNEIPPYSLLFFRGTGLISRWIGRVSGANLDGPTHVEMTLPPEAAILFGHRRQAVSFGATTMARTPDLWTGERQSGVQIWNLKDRVEQYEGDKIWVRCCNGGMTRLSPEMKMFLVREHGKPYERNPMRLLGVVIDWPWIDDFFDADSEESRFCSELTVRMLRILGYWDGAVNGSGPSEEYSPMNLFRSHLRGKYGEPEQIK